MHSPVDFTMVYLRAAGLPLVVLHGGSRDPTQVCIYLATWFVYCNNASFIRSIHSSYRRHFTRKDEM